MKMKKLLMSLVAGVSLILAGCQSGGGQTSEVNDDQLHVGGMFSLSGSYTAYGTPMINAIEMALEEINAEGGVNGQDVLLTDYDIKSDETEATSIATRLATQDNVDVILGADVSSATIAGIQSANRAQTPLVSPSATDDKTTVNSNGEAEPYGFSIAFRDSYQGVALAQFTEEVLGADKVAILADNSSDYALGLTNKFEEAFGGEIVAIENFSAGESDFNAVLTRLSGQDFDALFVPGYYEEAGKIIKQAREMGIDQPIIGPDGFGNDTLFELAGQENMNNVFYTSQFSSLSDNPKVEEFMTNYAEKYGKEADMFAALAYDTVYLVKQVVEEVGSTDSEAIREGLENMGNFDGITGSFHFDELHNPLKTINIVEVQNGEEVGVTEIQPEN